MRQKLQKLWLAGQIKTILFLSVPQGSFQDKSVNHALLRIGLLKSPSETITYGGFQSSGGESPLLSR